MHKWLSPSSIHYLQMHRQLIVGDNDEQVDELSRKLAAEELAIKVPKMQVSEKDGQMFALNNSSLQLMRLLEKQGKLNHGKIQVEVVPLSKVPHNIQMAMVTEPIEDCAKEKNKPESSRSNSKKKDYQKLQTGSPKTGAQGVDNNAVNRTNEDESDPEDDDEEEDEEDEASTESSASDLQCNVCDRSFKSARLLTAHQLSKKHFGCSVCDTVFPSLNALEEHKETLDHWSDDNDNQQTDEDNEETITIVRPVKEELERLL